MLIFGLIGINGVDDESLDFVYFFIGEGHKRLLVVFCLIEGFTFSPVVGLTLFLVVEILTSLCFGFCLALSKKLFVVKNLHKI